MNLPAINAALETLDRYRLLGSHPTPYGDPYVYEVESPDGLLLCTERQVEILCGPDALRDACSTCTRPVPPAEAAVSRRALGAVVCRECRWVPDTEGDQEGGRDE